VHIAKCPEGTVYSKFPCPLASVFPDEIAAGYDAPKFHLVVNKCEPDPLKSPAAQNMHLKVY